MKVEESDWCRRRQLKLEYEIKLARLYLESKRAFLTSCDQYDEENQTMIRLKKRLQLLIEE